MARKKGPEKVGNDIYGVNSNWKLDQKAGKSTEDGIRRSTYYHKYFRGYTEIRTEKANGGYKVERFYTEPWLVQDVTPAMYVWYRMMYVLLVVVTCAGYLALMCQDGFGGTYSLLVAIPEFASVVGLILLVAATVNYVFMRKRMTLYDHHSSSDNLKKASVIASACLAATALMIVVNIFLGVDSAINELKLAGCVLLCAAAAGVVYLIERGMPYREEENHTVLPAGEAHEIW
ncbi:MAG: hypothetical protein LUF35_05360 [Lachnospiraceae bacterium]|nr:hypothetical protein [Lachnospiraceae bacterium]